MIKETISTPLKLMLYAFLATSLNASAFELPWGIKDYETFNQCVEANPRTMQHKEFLDETCTRLFSGRPLSDATRKFLLCSRKHVLKTSTTSDARVAIFDCGAAYPPKDKETPLNIAVYYFPTSIELSQRRAAEAQERESIRRQDSSMRELMRPDTCSISSGVISCF